MTDVNAFESSTTTDPTYEEEKNELIFSLNSPRKCKLNVVCTLYPFVVLIIVIVAVVVWSISNALYSSAESDLVDKLTVNSVDASLRRISSYILSDGLGITERTQSTVLFSNLTDATVSTIRDTDSFRPFVLGEARAHPRLQALVFGCGNFFVALQKAYDAKAKSTGLLLYQFGVAINKTHWDAAVEFWDSKNQTLTSVKNYPSPSSYTGALWPLLDSRPLWMPVEFVQVGAIGSLVPVLAVHVLQKMNNQCGTAVQILLGDSVVAAWLTAVDVRLEGARFFVVNADTRQLLFTSDQDVTSAPDPKRTYRLIYVNETSNKAIAETDKYIEWDKKDGYSKQYNGQLGRTFFAASNLTANGLNWQIVLIVPTDNLFPNQRVSLITLLVTLAIILLAAGCSFLMAKLMSTPVSQLTKKMQDLAVGKWGERPPIAFRFIKEFSRAQRAFAVMETNLKLHTTKLDMLVKQRTKELEEALKGADRANRFKSNFLANMSHEIRTPLHGILSLVSFLIEAPLPQEQKEWCKDIQSSALALTQVLNDILDLSKVEAGKMVLECIEFDFLVVAEELTSLFYQILQEKGKSQLEIILQYSPSIPRKVMGDPTRIRQIITNLISNAIKFTEKGTIVLQVKAYKEVPPSNYRIPGSTEPARLDMIGFYVEVADSGIGMSPEQVSSLFTRYNQADVDTTRKYGGTGLGLAITKNLVEILGGHVTVESELGMGTKFMLYFYLGMDRTNAPQAIEPLPAIVKGIIVTPTKALYKAISKPLSKYCSWNWVKNLEKANAYVKSTPDLKLVLLDAPYLEEVKANFDALYDEDVRSRTKFILLKRSGIRRAVSTDVFHEVWSKPIKVSVLLENWADVISLNPSRNQVMHVETKYPNLDINVLLVEDNPLNQKVANLLLSRLKCTVTMCWNGLDAIAKVKESIPVEGGASSYDICLMDVAMPVMDGVTATQEIRKWEYEEQGGKYHLPIIALTAHAMADDKDKCLAAGMDAYLSKPLDKERLSFYLQKYSQRANRLSQ